MMKSKADKAQQIEDWNEEILGLKRKINDMAAQFERELKDTVVRLHSRIETSQKPMGSGGDDRSSEIALLRRLDEIAARRR